MNLMMSCRHRFFDELFPNWEIKYLFVGTFNPEWGQDNKNDLQYFYGRIANNFWCILPEIFNSHIKYDALLNKDVVIDFLINCKIGITDLIKSLANADENNPDHKKMVLSYSDINLESFEIENNLENIFKILENNNKNDRMKGVYFTRSSFNNIPKIYDLWNQVVHKCNDLGIKSETLITPSIRGGSCRHVYSSWKNKIVL